MSNTPTKTILQEIYEMLDTRITTINERTKQHTLDIKALKKEIKELNNRTL